MACPSQSTRDWKAARHPSRLEHQPYDDANHSWKESRCHPFLLMKQHPPRPCCHVQRKESPPHRDRDLKHRSMICNTRTRAHTHHWPHAPLASHHPCPAPSTAIRISNCRPAGGHRAGREGERETERELAGARARD
jgi:hypothetical protein